MLPHPSANWLVVSASSGSVLVGFPYIHGSSTTPCTIGPRLSEQAVYMDAAKKTQKLLVADPPRERAAFATMSRLISCLVTEQIIPAFYIPLNGAQAEANGFMFTLSGQTTSNDSICDARLSPDDIFAIVPLQHQPIFKENTNGETGCRIGLVDPMDMLPFVYWLTKSKAKKWVRDICFWFSVPLRLMISLCLDQDEHTESILSSLPVSWELGNRVGVCRVQDPLLLWRKFSETQPIDEKVSEAIENEIKSSFHWQSQLLLTRKTIYI